MTLKQSHHWLRSWSLIMKLFRTFDEFSTPQVKLCKCGQWPEEVHRDLFQRFVGSFFTNSTNFVTSSSLVPIIIEQIQIGTARLAYQNYIRFNDEEIHLAWILFVPISYYQHLFYFVFRFSLWKNLFWWYKLTLEYWKV